jgi:signal transduction histidine kinase
LVRRFASLPVCRFDRFQVERAVYNLVNNAIPETLAGGTVTVAVDAKLDGRFPDGGFVEIVVADTGRGMPADVLERILRGDPKSTKPGGTGLGTRIVHNAVAAHRGVFEGESAEGTGTTFRLKLPLLAE